MNEVQSKIIDAAKKLFVSQGYKKTTIRQIVDESGVLIGSIYHFFKNKEEIFGYIMVSTFDIADRLLVEKFGNELSSPLEFAILRAVELIAVESKEEIGELYYQAYSKESILSKIVSHTSKRAKRLLDPNNELTEEEHFLKTLGLAGIMRNYIALSYMKESISFETKLSSYLDVSLGMYDVDKWEIESIKNSVNEMIPEIESLVKELVEYTFKV